MQAEEMQSREELEQTLVARAIDDDQFRALLLENPRDAVRQELGIDVPSQIKITVHQERVDDFHLVLPISDRLSDNELSKIIGGWLPE